MHMSRIQTYSNFRAWMSSPQELHSISATTAIVRIKLSGTLITHNELTELISSTGSIFPNWERIGFIMTYDCFDKRTETFIAWFTTAQRRANGTFLGSDPVDNLSFKEGIRTASAPQISITDKRSEGKGRAVVATQDIESETTLFTVSHSDILSLSTSSVKNLVDSSELSVLPSWIACVLALIFEHGQGSEGKWWPYLSILPDEFDSLINWTNSELSELQGSHIIHKIGRADAEAAIETQLWPIIRTHALRFGDYAASFSDADQDKALRTLYDITHRFASLAMAYAFDLDRDDVEIDPKNGIDEDGFLEESTPEKGMVPFADMLNAEGRDLSNARLFHNGNSVSMVTTKEIKEGEEILNDYGSLPSAEILRCYGYTASAYEIYDVVELKTQKLTKAAETIHGISKDQVEKRLKLADSWDAFDESYDLLRNPSHARPLGEDLLLMTTLLVSDDAQFKHYKRSKAAPKPKLNLLIAELLMQAIQQRQKEYSTSIAEDEAIISSVAHTSKRKSMAVKVRLGEKQVLAQNYDFLQRFVNDSANGDISELEGPDSKRHKT